MVVEAPWSPGCHFGSVLYFFSGVTFFDLFNQLVSVRKHAIVVGPSTTETELRRLLFPAPAKAARHTVSFGRCRGDENPRGLR